jgi:hypothetical protein
VIAVTKLAFGIVLQAFLGQTRGLRMTLGLVLKIALGVVCFGIGAACLIGTVCILPFISATGAAAPAMFGVFAATFLWIAFLLLRQVRWHND